MRHELDLPRPSVFSAPSSHADFSPLMLGPRGLPRWLTHFSDWLITALVWTHLRIAWLPIAQLESESESCYDRRSVGQSVLVYSAHPGLTTRFFFPFGIRNTSDSNVLDSVGRPLWREDGSVFCMCRWPLPGQCFSVLVPWDLRPYVTVSDLRLPFSSPPTTRRVTVEVFNPASNL
jgi:hypothetical protein